MARKSKKNPLGLQKKSKQTPEVIDKLEYAFSIDFNIKEACLFAGISESIYYEWTKNDEKLLERFNMLKNTISMAVKTNIAKWVTIDKDKSANFYYADRRMKDYSNKLQIEQTNLNINMDTDDLLKITENAKKAIDKFIDVKDIKTEDVIEIEKESELNNLK